MPKCSGCGKFGKDWTPEYGQRGHWNYVWTCPSCVPNKALSKVTAALVAAVSLLEAGGESAAPSKKMFDQMLRDYKKVIEAGRKELERGNINE